MRSFDRSPNFKFARLVLADDAATPVGEDHGWNFQGYERAFFHILPIQTPDAKGEAGYGDNTAVTVGTPTSNPAIEVFFWQKNAGIWMPNNPAITFAAAGAGLARMIEVPAAGRRLTLKVTGVTGGQGVLIYAAAYSYSTME